MSQIDTTENELQVREIINKLYMADIAFDLEDETLAKELTYQSLCQLADHYTPYREYTEI